MEFLPAEIISEIVDNLGRRDYIHTSLVNKTFRSFSLLKIKLITTQLEFEAACRNGDLLSIVSSPYEEYVWNGGLYRACEGGHLNIIELMISKGAGPHGGWNNGLFYACLGGHVPIVELLISKGANDWIGGLYHACRGGHMPIVELMINKGADKCYCGKTIDEHIITLCEYVKIKSINFY